MMTEKVLVNAPICVLGVDPGKSGAVVRIGKGRFDVRRDFKELRDIAFAIRELSTGVDCAVIELVHAMPGQGVCSMFSFGRATGAAFGAIFLSLPPSSPLVEVAPLRWQNFFRSEMGVDKSEAFHSPTLASRLFPSFSQPYLKRKKDHNTADAILLATYWLLLGPEARQMSAPAPI
jgi:crossover junction endodeoxyribonuclease RuvC